MIKSWPGPLILLQLVLVCVVAAVAWTVSLIYIATSFMFDLLLDACEWGFIQLGAPND